MELTYMIWNGKKIDLNKCKQTNYYCSSLHTMLKIVSPRINPKSDRTMSRRSCVHAPVWTLDQWHHRWYEPCDISHPDTSSTTEPPVNALPSYFTLPSRRSPADNFRRAGHDRSTRKNAFERATIPRNSAAIEKSTNFRRTWNESRVLFSHYDLTIGDLRSNRLQQVLLLIAYGVLESLNF